VLVEDIYQQTVLGLFVASAALTTAATSGFAMVAHTCTRQPAIRRLLSSLEMPLTIGHDDTKECWALDVRNPRHASLTGVASPEEAFAYYVEPGGAPAVVRPVVGLALGPGSGTKDGPPASSEPGHRWQQRFARRLELCVSHHPPSSLRPATRSSATWDDLLSFARTVRARRRCGKHGKPPPSLERELAAPRWRSSPQV